MNLATSWNSTSNPGHIQVDDRFDSAGDLCVTVRGNGSGPGRYADTWLDRDKVAKLRDHLDALLGDKPRSDEPAVTSDPNSEPEPATPDVEALAGAFSLGYAFATNLAGLHR